MLAMKLRYITSVIEREDSAILGIAVEQRENAALMQIFVHLASVRRGIKRRSETEKSARVALFGTRYRFRKKLINYHR